MYRNEVPITNLTRWLKKRYFRLLPQILPQDAFAGCTVLTIAHRFVCMNNQLSTIIGFKRRIIKNNQTIYKHSPLHNYKNVGVHTAYSNNQKAKSEPRKFYQQISMDTKILSIDINGYKSPKSRLDTVMGYDQVLVLDQGRLVEQGANILYQIFLII